MVGTSQEWNKKTVNQLRALCKRRGLEVDGTKKVLVTRLEECEAAKDPSTAVEASADESSKVVVKSATPKSRATKKPQQKSSLGTVASDTPATRKVAIRWSAEVDEALKTYYHTYARFEETMFHLIHAAITREHSDQMASISVIDTGRRLLELQLIEADVLFRWLPELEEEDPFYESKQFLKSAADSEAARKLAASLVLQQDTARAHEVFAFLKSQVDDCILVRGFDDGLSMASQSADADSTADQKVGAHYIYTTCEEDKRLLHNRWTPKLMKSLGFKRELSGGEPKWTIPPTCSTVSLEEARRMLLRFHEKADVANAQRQAAASRERTAAAVEAERVERERRKRMADFDKLLPDTTNAAAKVFGSLRNSNIPTVAASSAATKRKGGEPPTGGPRPKRPLHS